MGGFFLSSLRWVAKDDRGCTNPIASNYNALAAVNDGNCLTTGLGWARGSTKSGGQSRRGETLRLFSSGPFRNGGGTEGRRAK